MLMHILYVFISYVLNETFNTMIILNCQTNIEIWVLDSYSWPSIYLTCGVSGPADHNECLSDPFPELTFKKDPSGSAPPDGYPISTLISPNANNQKI